MRKTKIIVTLGPATDNKRLLKQIAKYVNGFRFNFSHGDHKEHKRRFKLVKKIADENNIALIADTSGPEIRTTNKEPIEIRKGKIYDLYEIGVNYEGLYKDVKKGDRVLIDGQIEFKIIEVKKKSIKMKAKNCGVITYRRHVNIPGRDLSLPSLTQKDISDLEFISKIGFDIIAQSFVKSGEDIKKTKKLTGLRVIAKIENSTALKNLSGIIKESDGIMVARGDLGVEVPIEKVPFLQRKIIEKSISNSKPVIVATHMMKSMVESSLPSRAEATDVANAVLMGADCLMLSEETSIGKNPLKAVIVMDKIIREAEKSFTANFEPQVQSEEEIITKNAVKIAEQFRVPVLVPTLDGGSPKNVAKYRPKTTIYAVTREKTTIKYLSIVYGVKPINGNFKVSVESFNQMLRKLKLKHGMFLFPYPRKVGGDINAMVYI